MATLREFLLKHREPVPAWLADFRAGDGWNRDAFFAHRVIYYPGSGDDPHPVEVFGSTHAAHCFVYVDDGIAREELVAWLDASGTRFSGYHSLARICLSEEEVGPRVWDSYIRLNETLHSGLPDPGRDHDEEDSLLLLYPAGRARDRFGFIEILERDESCDEIHGPKRMAIPFLGAEGARAYGELFCRGHGKVPFSLVAQNYFSGGFGAGSPIEIIARHCNVFPRFLLVAQHTNAWVGYARIPEVEGEPGGGGRLLRELFSRDP